MAATVAQMTRDELQELIGSVVEKKLVELFGDPDEGLSLKKTLENRLARQMASVAGGDRGKLLDDVTRQLGLD